MSPRKETDHVYYCCNDFAILGILHALWHLPGFFVIGWLGPFTLPGFVVFILVGIATTLLWTWICNTTKGRLSYNPDCVAQPAETSLVVENTERS